MTPRKYSLGKRAAGVARTRAAIVGAAMEAYREQPVEMVSMQEVARRADVSPATVLNHFPRPEELTEAVVEELWTRLEVPSLTVLEGAEGRDARVRAVARALSRFFDRAEPWFEVHRRESPRLEAFARGAREFDEAVMALIRAALGPDAGARAVGVTRTVLSHPLLLRFQRLEGMSAEGAGDQAAEVVLAWLDSRSGEEVER